ncbi:Uncharacterised protein [Streptococcus pneumoniae]|nr:Uncharacterised protein [Streptococcus pneumoniae]
MVVRCKANPLPSSPCKCKVMANLVMIAEITVVFFLAILIIIPVNQSHTVFETV